MKDESFYQFPLAALGMKAEPETIANCIISYGIVSAGLAVLQGLDQEARLASCAEFGLAAELANSGELAAHLGAQRCGNKINTVAGTVQRYEQLRTHAEKWHARYGRRGGEWAVVRLRSAILFDLRDHHSISWREFRVLAGIYSVIGSKAYPVRITLGMIDARHCGLLNQEGMDLALEVGDGWEPLTPKQLRLTVEKLWLLGWFARVTPDPHGRMTFYSHRMSEEQMREKLFTRATVKLESRARHRAENEKLAARIRAAKDAWQQPPATGVLTSSPAGTFGRRNGGDGAPSRQLAGSARAPAGHL